MPTDSYVYDVQAYDVQAWRTGWLAQLAREDSWIRWAPIFMDISYLGTVGVE